MMQKYGRILTRFLRQYTLSPWRAKGIAKALDLTGMKALRAKGYQYAISGMVHPSGRRLDEEIVKLIPIPDSAGSYCNML